MVKTVIFTSLRQLAGSLYVCQCGSSDASFLGGVLSRSGDGDGDVCSRTGVDADVRSCVGGDDDAPSRVGGEELRQEAVSSLSGTGEDNPS